jgi:Flp pilus assembly protein TadD
MHMLLFIRGGAVVGLAATALLVAGCNDSSTDRQAKPAQVSSTPSTSSDEKPKNLSGAGVEKLSDQPPPDSTAKAPNSGSSALPVDKSAANSKGGAKDSDASPIEPVPGTPPQYVLPEALEHYKKARELAQKGQSAAAKDEFTEALRIQPDFMAGRNDFGTFLLSQGDLITASIIYKEGLKLRPDDSDAHNDYGVVLIRAGDAPGARKEFEKAIELKDDNPEPHHNLGLLLMTVGDLDAAIVQFNSAVRLRPSYVDAHFDLGRALIRTGRLEDAIAQFREVLRLQRGHFGALYNLGISLTKLGKAGEAIKEYTQALRANPNDAELRLALGLALVKLGNDREAIPNFIEAIRLRPENADAHYELALALAKLGRIDEAIAHNEEALNLRPDWPEALNNLAWILATNPNDKLRNQKRAVELADRARELAEYKMPLVLDTQAAALAEAGKFPEAVKVAERAVALAREAGQERVAQDIQTRLDLYRAGKAYHEPAPPKAPVEEK